MKKLNNEKSIQLLEFLKKIKQQGYVFLPDYFELLDWHESLFKINYDYLKSEECVKKMLLDLMSYFDKDILIIENRRCTKCRKYKPIGEFFADKICKKCFKVS